VRDFFNEIKIQNQLEPRREGENGVSSCGTMIN
jgi:hypothetical protein